MVYQIYANNELLFASDWNEPEYQIVSPTLKQEINKSGTLEFTIFPQHPLYDKLSPMSTKVKVLRDGATLFYGRVLSNDTDIFKQRKVYCEGCLSYLIDSVFPPSKGKRTVEEHFRKLISEHNNQVEQEKKFTAGQITIDEKGNNEELGEDSYRETFSAFENDLVDSYGGFIRIRYEGDTRYIDYLKEYPDTNTQTIEYGQNLIELTNKDSGEDLFTILLPVGKDKLTIESAGSPSSASYTKNGKYLEIKDAVSKYGRIIKPQDFGNVDNANTLLQKAEKYIKDNYKGIPPEITVKAIDLHILYPSVTPFKLGDKLRIKSSPHGIDKTLMCSAIDYDLKSPENVQYTLQDPNQIVLKKDKTLSGATSSASETASSARRSGAGGAAAASLLEQFITEENGVLTIKDSKIHLETLPGGTLGQITAALDMGDGQIISNVKNSLEGLDTKITQTDRSIRADVSDSINKVEGSIELTIKDVDGLKQSVFTIDTDITNINSKITNIENLYAKKAYVDELTTQSAIINLLDGGYVKTAALTTNSADIGYLEVSRMTFSGSTVNKGQVKVVTDFTQASTYGIHLEGDTSMTFLRISEAFVDSTYTPSYGEKITFS